MKRQLTRLVFPWTWRKTAVVVGVLVLANVATAVLSDADPSSRREPSRSDEAEPETAHPPESNVAAIELRRRDDGSSTYRRIASLLDAMERDCGDSRVHRGLHSERGAHPGRRWHLGHAHGSARRREEVHEPP